MEARQPKDAGYAGDLRSSTTTAKPASPTPESADPDLGRSDLRPTTSEDDPVGQPTSDAAAAAEQGRGAERRRGARVAPRVAVETTRGICVVYASVVPVEERRQQ